MLDGVLELIINEVSEVLWVSIEWFILEACYVDQDLEKDLKEVIQPNCLLPNRESYYGPRLTPSSPSWPAAIILLINRDHPEAI